MWMLKFPTDDGALHLAEEAAAHGLGPERIIATELLPQESHLTSKSVAHLYLDTFVYNGHTTSADALWAGVPMLTMPGPKQISRTAAGFATALGLQSMVAESMKQFEVSGELLCLNPCLPLSSVLPRGLSLASVLLARSSISGGCELLAGFCLSRRRTRLCGCRAPSVASPSPSVRPSTITTREQTRQLLNGSDGVTRLRPRTMGWDGMSCEASS